MKIRNISPSIFSTGVLNILPVTYHGPEETGTLLYRQQKIYNPNRKIYPNIVYGERSFSHNLGSRVDAGGHVGTEGHSQIIEESSLSNTHDPCQGIENTLKDTVYIF